LAQRVDGWKQQLGDFLAAGIDAFQITPQHVERVAQRGELHVAVLAGADRDVGSQLQYFLREQLGAGQLDEVECAAHLLEVLHGLLQQAAVVAIDDEMLEALLGFFHGGEQFVTYQTE